MSKEVTTTTKPELSKPETMLAFAEDLKTFIVKKELYTNIKGKNYVNVEGWQFAGMNMGLVAVVVSCDRIEGRGSFTYKNYDTKEEESLEEVAYKAVLEVYSGDKVVSRAFTICSNKEPKKRTFDEYAIASMAQTRALGKAYRMLLGPLMKMAGYEGTPSEEMDESYVDVEPRGTDSKAYCVDCGKEMALYVKGDKKGQFHCKGKNAMPGDKPACPPRELTDWEKKVATELDATPVPENLQEKHQKDCTCDQCIPTINI